MSAGKHAPWCAAEDDHSPCEQMDHALYLHREPWFETYGERGDVALRLRLVRADWSDGRRDPVGVEAFVSIDGADPVRPADIALLTVAQARAWGATLLAFAERASS